MPFESVWHIRHPFKSTSAEFGFAVVARPVLAADKAKRDRFDILPELELTFEILKEALGLPPDPLLEIFPSPPRGVAPAINLEVRKGGGRPSKPMEDGWRSGAGWVNKQLRFV